MVRDLFINMAILISFISLGSQISKKFDFEDKVPIRSKITMGIILGALGCILMLFSVRVSEITIIDFRHIAFVISAIIGGTIPLLATSTMISIFRIAYFGVNIASLIGVIAALLSSLCCWYVGKLKINRREKWAYATISAMVVSALSLTIMLRERSDFLIMISIYCVSHCFVSLITYWYVDYSLTANKHFRRLQKESSKDFLTGLNNVRQFDSVFNDAIRSAREKEENLSLLMVDIDFFKRVNDTYGHIEGDCVLKELGKILAQNCSAFDEVSRNGGEEFSVLLSDCSNIKAIQTAENIRKQVQAHPFILTTGMQISITVSIGVASYPETTIDIEKLIEKADSALYTAKRTGRNRVCSLSST